MMGYGTVSAESTKGCPLKVFPGLSKANGLFVCCLLLHVPRLFHRNLLAIMPRLGPNLMVPVPVELDVPCPPATIP